jgi:Divergent InlB B-repeat domain
VVGLVAAGADPEAAYAASWCGSAAGSADVLPDGVGGNQFHVVYVVPSDGPDRFAQVAGLIAADVGDVLRWWRREDPTRAPRFDVTSGDCLDMSAVRLSQPAAALVGLNSRYRQIADGLQSVLADLHKKGLVYYDSPLPLEGEVCGQAAPAPLVGGPRSAAVVYVAPNLFGLPGCGSLGTADYGAVIAAHEMVHALGALVPGAPHACAGDAGHPCDSALDILAPSGADCCLNGLTLDVGRDDYYAHGQGWWDVRNSSWLSHLDAPAQPLTVRLVGDTADTSLRSDVPGISCPPACSISYDGGETVALNGEWGEGRWLVRWEGDCTGSGPCSVAMTAPRSVTAVVRLIRYALRVRVRGKGHVTSAPAGLISCPRKCSASYEHGKPVRLTARAARGSRFVGWGGDCSGRRGCVLADSDTSVTAVFRHR